MYSLFRSSRSTQEDILAIQILYGEQKTIATTAASMSLNAQQMTPYRTIKTFQSKKYSDCEISLCVLGMRNFLFVILRYNYYIFHTDIFRSMSLETKIITRTSN